MAAPLASVRSVLGAIRLSQKSRTVWLSGKGYRWPKVGQHSLSTSSGDDSGADGGDKKPRLNLARPPARLKKPTHVDPTTEESKTSSDSESDLDSDMVSAVKDVAKCLGDESGTTESDLLSQLRNHQTLVETLKEDKTQRPGIPMRVMFSGMRVEHRRQRAGRGSISRSGSHLKTDGAAAAPSHESSPNEDGKPMGIISEMTKSRNARKRGDPANSLKLFDGPALGIFTTDPETGVTESTEVKEEEKSIFDSLQEEERKRQLRYPPSNAFDEMIRWTQEGKLWNFPIDNEQGLDEEALVGFHEHVFLEPLISDFPRRGPLRHFMELVCVGLSKNPYLTVQQKKDHIDWFRQYFADKKHILDEVIVDKDQVAAGSTQLEQEKSG